MNHLEAAKYLGSGLVGQGIMGSLHVQLVVGEAFSNIHRSPYLDSDNIAPPPDFGCVAIVGRSKASKIMSTNSSSQGLPYLSWGIGVRGIEEERFF